MKAFEKNGTLFLVPESDLIASQIEDIRSFIMQQLKTNHQVQQVTLDVKGVGIVDSLGVNLIIGLYKELSAESKTFSITNAGKKFMQIVNFFHLNILFTVETDDSK